MQGNINIEMQKTSHHYTLPELLSLYKPLIEQCPPGLIVWTETALPTYLKDSRHLLDWLAEQAAARHAPMIVGSLDRDEEGRPYNSAFWYHHWWQPPAVRVSQALSGALWRIHAQLRQIPARAGAQAYLDPGRQGFNAGKTPVVLDLAGNRIASLICFETLSPELVVSSVRNGGELLVNLSDLAWFHNSMVGDQMVAFSVMRAVETGRYFVFAANTGPSVVIDTRGRIAARSRAGSMSVLTSDVRFLREMTLFTQWFN